VRDRALSSPSVQTRDGSEAEGLRKVVDEMPESYVKGLLMTRICFDDADDRAGEDVAATAGGRRRAAELRVAIRAGRSPGSR
jgi:hypothetical protein